MDDDLADLNERVPGFGGFYRDADGVFHVFLTDPTAKAAAVTAIAAFLERRGADQKTRALAAGMVVDKGTYTFQQLKSWYGALVQSVFATSGIVLTDIDDTQNNIRIGVIDQSTLEKVNALIRGSVVPSEAVRVSIAPPFVVGSTLQQKYEPVAGGQQITNQTSGAICTLGFDAYTSTNNVVDSTQGYFVTNSHCTSQFGVVNGDYAGQPDFTWIIGHEVSDPPLFNAATNNQCPLRRACRYSDAALFHFDGAPFFHGVVHRPYPGTINVWDSYAISHTSEPLYVGQPVNKVGRTTGDTGGNVTALCITTAQYSGGSDTGRTMLCQATASYSSGGGDSGSPVLYYASPPPPGLHNPMEVIGLHWGSGGVFSTFPNLRNEISAQMGIWGLYVGQTGP